MWDAPPAAAPAAAEFLPTLDMPEPEDQNRLTVLLRLLMLIPQFIVVWVLSVVAFFVSVIGWFGALALGRLPDFAATYLAGFVAYETRVNAYAMLTHDRYPPFAFQTPEYPVRVGLKPGELNRLAVFFRLILAIPAAIVQSVLLTGWWTVSFISWLVVLILGRMPRPLFEASAAIVRYRMRFQAYLLMLTAAYPKGLFGEDPSTPAAAPGAVASATRPLVLSGAGRGLLVVFILVGIAASLTSSLTGTFTSDDDNDDLSGHVTAPLHPGPVLAGR
ncbi:DUF4389 domain-containing protein [Kitasatospora sp. NBC_00240]|uniref:DUF4389 domain-containing protein n=1 Tax=Kitasatospora sp. NBC_00240 TaxID=2903567 RepID=UPI00224FD311|nr:DUF4389 domain-containing protein [Kitasatospora sp. NBC_00240]MCX5207839.1 DUF4389 domain-containing protein [Kitasatospora sp. NBC_00240]